MRIKNRETKLYYFAVVLFLLFSPMTAQDADAQLFKRLFKKKAKTEQQQTAVNDGIDDELQLAMKDVTTLPDNSNNRNAFLEIPLGIKASNFERQLLAKGFAERKHDGPQTGKSYIYDGEVFGQQATVTLAVSEKTQRVYAVDIAEAANYDKAGVDRRFQQLKAELRKVYGAGYVDNQGEAYTIQTQLGTVSMHYERASGVSVYNIGFALDDAKAYLMAYNEMDDKEYEEAPRAITNGLAPACNHTDIVGLGVRLLQNATLKGVQTVAKSYDYTVGKATAKAVPASFAMGAYKATVTMTRRRQQITAVTIAANDDAAAVGKDLQTYGFTTAGNKTWRQGRMTATVGTDKQGRVVVTMK